MNQRPGFSSHWAGSKLRPNQGGAGHCQESCSTRETAFSGNP